MEPQTLRRIPNQRTSNSYAVLLRSIRQYLRRSSSIPPPFSFNPPPFSAVLRGSKVTNAFCSGGDHALRTEDGYSDHENISCLNVLDLQVGSFGAGYRSSIMLCLVGPKKMCKMWFLTRFYIADEADKMGLINTFVPVYGWNLLRFLDMVIGWTYHNICLEILKLWKIIIWWAGLMRGAVSIALAFKQDGNEVFFRIKRNTQLKKLMNAYCDRQSVDLNSIAFLFDGRRLRAEQTPDELEMEDGDEIDAMLHQTGGALLV